MSVATRAAAAEANAAAMVVSVVTGRWGPCCSVAPIGTRATPPPSATRAISVELGISVQSEQHPRLGSGRGVGVVDPA